MSGRAKEKALLERIAANAGKIPGLDIKVSDGSALDRRDGYKWFARILREGNLSWIAHSKDQGVEFKHLATLLIDMIEAADLAVFERYHPFGSPVVWRGFLRSNGFHDGLASAESDEHLAILECITQVLEALPEVPA